MTVTSTLVSQRRAVPAGLVTPAGQRFHLAGELRERGDHVEVVEVTRGQAERLLLAATTDQQRDVVAEARLGGGVLGLVVAAGEGGPLALDHRQDDLQRLFELVEPVGEGAELIAQLVVFEFEPAGTDAEDGPPLADHVEGGDHLRQQGGVAVGVTGSPVESSPVRQ